jgi:two-component system response regulator
VSDSVILLVDDNPDDVFMTKHAFEKNSMSNRIIVAEDGEAALRMLLPDNGEPALEPALVLLDLNMPKIGGFEVLTRLRADQRTECLPVVILTTSELDEDRLKSYKTGANAFVRKPVEFNDFREAAEALSLFWMVVNQRA